MAVTEIGELAAGVGEGFKVFDAGAAARDGVKEAELGKDFLAAGLEEEAGADGADLGGALEEGDVVPGTGEEDGECAAGDAEAGDADAEWVGHGRRVLRGELGCR